jgi:DNA transformation protein
MSDSFRDYILEQLAELDGVTFRKMFGAYGLYLEKRFFGVIDSDMLFFKTDESTRGKYQKAGMKPFAPTPDQVLKNYYEVPTEVIEDPKRLCEWAREASNR